MTEKIQDKLLKKAKDAMYAYYLATETIRAADLKKSTDENKKDDFLNKTINKLIELVKNNQIWEAIEIADGLALDEKDQVCYEMGFECEKTQGQIHNIVFAILFYQHISPGKDISMHLDILIDTLIDEIASLEEEYAKQHRMLPPFASAEEMQSKFLTNNLKQNVAVQEAHAAYYLSLQNEKDTAIDLSQIDKRSFIELLQAGKVHEVIKEIAQKPLPVRDYLYWHLGHACHPSQAHQYHINNVGYAIWLHRKIHFYSPYDHINTLRSWTAQVLQRYQVLTNKNQEAKPLPQKDLEETISDVPSSSEQDVLQAAAKDDSLSMAEETPTEETINLFHFALHDAHTSAAEVREFILRFKLDVNKPHPVSHQKPIQVAVRSGDLDKVKLLVEEMKVDLDASQLDCNLFYHAAYFPHLRYYLADTNTRTNGKCLYENFNDGTTELHAAIVGEDFSAVTRILFNSPESLETPNQHGETAIFFAALTDNLFLTNFLRSIAIDPKSNAVATQQAFDDQFYRGVLHGKLMEAQTLLMLNKRLEEEQKALGNASWQTQNTALSFKIASIYHTCLNAGLTILKKTERDFMVIQLVLRQFHVFNRIMQNPTIEKQYKHVENKFQIMMGMKSHRSVKFNFSAAKSPLRSQPIIVKSNLDIHAELLGLAVYTKPKNGNCFYLALIEQVEKAGISLPPDYKNTVADYRHLAVKHLNQYRSEYEPFFFDTSFDDFISEINKDGSWADEFVIQALARELKITMVIIDDRGPNYRRIFKPKESKAITYFGFSNTNHYDSLLTPEGILPLTPPPEIQKAIEKIIDNKEELSELTEDVVKDPSPSPTTSPTFCNTAPR